MFDTSVVLNQYTKTSGYYKFPTDGYLKIEVYETGLVVGANIYGNIYNAAADSIYVNSIKEATFLTPVRKGMRFKTYHDNAIDISRCVFRFIPLQ